MNQMVLIIASLERTEKLFAILG